MAFSLDSIRGTKLALPSRLLLHGPHKIGKSSFAAQAEGAIFIPTEDGLSAIKAEAFPLCKSWDDITSAVVALYTEKNDFKTVVLDTADWAESLAHKRVCKDNEVESIEKIGYGKGYVFVSDLFRELLEGLNALRLDRGMQIIILAHTEIRRFDDPQADSYDRYQIKLHKLIGKMLQEWSDIIGFAQQDTVTKIEKGKGFKEDRTRALSTGRRVIRTEATPAFDAGNRYGLPAELPLEYAAFAEALNNAKKG